MIQRIGISLSILLITLSGTTLFAQEVPEQQVVLGDTIEVVQDSALSGGISRSLAFINHDANQIQNAVSLGSFYERLYALRHGQKIKVNIIHIGDSHIQADFLTHVVREHFQSDFGNGGRGLVTPGRVAHTNQPSNLMSSSTSLWESKRVVFPEKPLPIGVGGITLKTTQPNASFSLGTRDGVAADYAFNRVTLFYQKDLSSFNVGIKDSAGRDLAFLGPYTFEAYPNTSTVILPISTHRITFQMLPSMATQNQFILFGINLENTNPGVLYHAIGVNGAKFKHYVAANLFAEQVAALQPDLIILSLGTNEALDYPYADPLFTLQIDQLVQKLKTSNPQAQILFSTIPDSFRRKIKRNPGVENVRAKIIEYAEKRNFAIWDLYEAGGGKHAADHWRKSGLLQRDGVHFTVKGYELQGNLLYEALMKGYDEYVQYRHP